MIQAIIAALFAASWFSAALALNEMNKTVCRHDLQRRVGLDNALWDRWGILVTISKYRALTKEHRGPRDWGTVFTRLVILTAVLAFTLIASVAIGAR